LIGLATNLAEVEEFSTATSLFCEELSCLTENSQFVFSVPFTIVW